MSDHAIDHASAEEPACRVVVNLKGQFSLQASFLPVPAGWRDAGMTGAEEACLAYITEQWTAMRQVAPAPRFAAAGRAREHVDEGTPR